MMTGGRGRQDPPLARSSGQREAVAAPQTAPETAPDTAPELAPEATSKRTRDAAVASLTARVRPSGEKARPAGERVMERAVGVEGFVAVREEHEARAASRVTAVIAGRTSGRRKELRFIMAATLACQ